jgi:hypothetical protein
MINKKTIKKDKYMSKDEFAELLKKIKLEKLLQKYRNQQQQQEKRLKKKFYHIEDFEEQANVHHLDPNYEQLKKQKELEAKWLETVFQFPFERLKNKHELKKEAKIRREKKIKLMNKIRDKVKEMRPTPHTSVISQSHQFMKRFNSEEHTSRPDHRRFERVFIDTPRIFLGDLGGSEIHEIRSPPPVEVQKPMSVRRPKVRGLKKSASLRPQFMKQSSEPDYL